MAEGVRDAQLGRLGLATIYDNMTEGVGDTLAVTGAGVALGERKPKRYAFNLAVHGTQGDPDPYAAGLRMRRQVRALMENSRLRGEGLYFQFLADLEQNGWVLLGGGQLEYMDGGVSLAQFQLTLDDAYRVGSLRTHRPARRVELYDRRLATTPRDWLGQVFGTDYAALTAQAITYLPVGVTDVVGSQKAPVAYGTRTGLGGATPVVVGRTHGEVLNYEWAEAAMNGWDDVVVWDRAGQGDPPGGYAATTLAYRPRLYLRVNEANGATAAVDSSDWLNNGVYVGSPLYRAPSLLVGDTDASVGLDQSVGAYVRVPDNASLDIVGDLTLRLRVQPRTGVTGLQGLVGKAATPAGQRGWRWGWDPATGEMVANLEPDGGLTVTATGNEVTDATRAAVLGTGSSGQMMDGRLNDGSFGVRRTSTNLFRQGQCGALTDWGTLQAGVVPTLDATVPPRFSTQSVKYTCDGTVANQGGQALSAAGQAAGAGLVGATSIWFKGVAGASYTVNTRWVHTDATSVDGAVTTFTATGGDQLLVPAAVSVAAAKTGDTLRICVQINGTRAESFWLAHAMLEKGVFYVNPYVATTGGATATHPGGRIQMPVGLVTLARGWWAGWVRMGGTPGNMGQEYGVSNPGRLFAYGDSAGEKVSAYPSTSFNGSITANYQHGGNNVSVGSAPGIWANQGDLVFIVLYWNGTELGLSVNGGNFTKGVIAGGQTWAASTVNIGSLTDGSAPINSDELWTALGNGALVDADAGTLYTMAQAGVVQPYRLPGSCTAVWAADTTVYESAGRWAGSIGAAITPGQAAELGMVYTAAAGSVQFYRNGVLLNTVTGLPTSLFANSKQVTISKWESDS